jgi:hypothetical protein
MQGGFKRWILLPSVLLLLASVRVEQAQAPKPASDLLSRPASQWAAEAATSEIGDLQLKGDYVRYLSHVINNKGDMVRDVIESKDGTVARLILRDNKPISTDEDNAERSRLQAMLDSPETFARHIKSDESGRKTAIDVIRQMPDAMLYSYTPGQPQRERPNPGAAPDVVLDFKPNPAWTPPTLATDALTGIEGRLWIDARSHHLIRLEAQVFRPVSVGFGIFAKIFPGGGIALDEVQVNDHRWIYNHFQENITLRALMVKTIRENSEARAYGFDAVPPISYQDAIHMLLDIPLPQH